MRGVHLASYHCLSMMIRTASWKKQYYADVAMMILIWKNYETKNHDYNYCVIFNWNFLRNWCRNFWWLFVDKKQPSVTLFLEICLVGIFVYTIISWWHQPLSDFCKKDFLELTKKFGGKIIKSLAGKYFLCSKTSTLCWGRLCSLCSKTSIFFWRDFVLPLFRNINIFLPGLCTSSVPKHQYFSG